MAKDNGNQSSGTGDNSGQTQGPPSAPPNSETTRDGGQTATPPQAPDNGITTHESKVRNRNM